MINDNLISIDQTENSTILMIGVKDLTFMSTREMGNVLVMDHQRNLHYFVESVPSLTELLQ